MSKFTFSIGPSCLGPPILDMEFHLSAEHFSEIFVALLSHCGLQFLKICILTTIFVGKQMHSVHFDQWLRVVQVNPARRKVLFCFLIPIGFLPSSMKGSSQTKFSLNIFCCEMQLYKSFCPSVGMSVGQAFLKNREFKGIQVNSTKFNKTHNILQLLASRICSADTPSIVVLYQSNIANYIV